MLLFFALLLYCANCILVSSVQLTPLKPSEEYLHNFVVDDNNPDQYVIYWNIIEETIQFEVHCKSTGWVGLGISPNGGMSGADIAIGWVNDNNGTVYLKDCHAPYPSQPLVDKSQDLNLIAGAQVNGYTILKFSRKLKTCDLAEDYNIETGSNYMIFAWNNQDPIGNNWMKHASNSRFTKAVLLINHKTEVFDQQNTLPSDAFYYEFHNNNVTIPPKETFYYCDLFELPRFSNEDIQLIRIDMVPNKKNVAFLHHVVVYECRDEYYTNKTLNHECGAVRLPQEINVNCLNKYVFAWGVGGPYNYSFPKDSGYKVTYAPDATRKMYLIETHYNNPDYIANVVDDSGVRFYFTKQSRQNNLGLLRIGTDDLPLSIQVPPRTQKFTYTTICYPTCTQKFFPSSGITAISGIQHTHMLGRSLRTTVIRNNKEIGYLFNSPHYDFNYQFVIDIEPYKLYPGDALVTECVYDSSDRTDFTLWGFSSIEEMCVQNVFYYPRIPNFIQCHSVPSHDSLENFYSSLMNKNLLPKIDLNDFLKNGSYEAMVSLLMNIQIKDELINEFNKFYNSKPNQAYFCGEPTNNNSLDVKDVKFFSVPNKYVEPQYCNNARRNSILLSFVILTFSVFFSLVKV